MKHIRLVLAAMAVFIGLGTALPAFASAESAKSTVCKTLESDATCSKDNSGGVSLSNVVRDAINILSVVIGIAAVFMIIIGGFRYVTSGGDANNVSGAKNTILYAIIGLVVVSMAQIIVQFVLHKVK